MTRRTQGGNGKAQADIVGVVGCGVTGSRVVSNLAGVGRRVAAYDPLPVSLPSGVVRVDDATDLAVCDVVVLAHPAPHASLAKRLLRSGASVVSISDDLDDVRELLTLQTEAEVNDAVLVVGCGVAPGLSGLLARYLAAQLHSLDELHVAIHGTAGPECARQHHKALGDGALGWHDNEWIEPPGGSGRDLVWFPEPIAAHDCYRAALADPLLLQRAFSTAARISARVSATRRDRLTARLPMLLPPHASGDLGAVRVEARGANATGGRETVIAGASAPTAELAAAVAVAVALTLVDHRPAVGVYGTADAALEPLELLRLATDFGVRVQEFTGVARATSW
ncbi:MAG: hypothetical protein K8R99_02135 [Actinomycetia bacterium]|nr:hypothetical protein [Actinomycetes bacterium]